MAGVYPGVGQRCGKEGLALYFSFSNQHTRDHHSHAPIVGLNAPMQTSNGPDLARLQLKQAGGLWCAQ